LHVRQLFDLTGKNALVTGGGRGIGRHIAIGLAEAGADVAVASRKLPNCEEVARAISDLGRRALALEADVGEPEDVAALADRVIREFERVDILVNNAGVIWGAPTLEYPLSGWDKVFGVNVRGLWLLSQAIARHMRDAGGGSIVHITSISALRGAREEAEPAIAYSASKGAVHALTRDMAVKLLWQFLGVLTARLRNTSRELGEVRGKLELADMLDLDDEDLEALYQGRTLCHRSDPRGRRGPDRGLGAHFTGRDAAAHVSSARDQGVKSQPWRIATVRFHNAEIGSKTRVRRSGVS